MSTFLAVNFPTVDLAPAFESLIEMAGTQLSALIPIGVGFMFLLAVPRVIRRIIGGFV